MLLGAILTEFSDERQAAAALAALGDLALVAEVETARLPHEETIGEYVTGATQRFARLASDEDWLALMTALERGGQPAAICLQTMLRWSLRQDAADPHACGGGCTCGAGGTGDAAG